MKTIKGLLEALVGMFVGSAVMFAYVAGIFFVVVVALILTCPQ